MNSRSNGASNKNKLLEYERRKAALQVKGLPQKEYDKAMQTLIKELRV